MLKIRRFMLIYLYAIMPALLTLLFTFSVMLSIAAFFWFLLMEHFAYVKFVREWKKARR